MQKYWSVLFGAVITAAVGLFVVAPFMGWWLPRNVSSFGGDVDLLFYLILGITGFFFVLTEAILVYGIWKFSSDPTRKATYTHGNHKLEVLWTIVPAGILVMIGIVQVRTWENIKYQSRMPRPGANTQQIEVVARQWEWRIRYPSPKRMASWRSDPRLAQDFGAVPHQDDVHVPNELHVWRHQKGEEPQKVLVHLKTRDVLHSMKLVNLRLMQDAVPGKTIPVWFMVEEYNTSLHPETGRWVDGFDPKTGHWNQKDYVWELACAEFCGTRHTAMKGKLFVHKNRDDFLEWLKWAEAEDHRRTPAVPSTEP
ncbi:MAG: cytochrome c oxidase subunit II [Gemmataceae bacterium]|nr:cytochrome c oxidase subunit II [Gemmataceae bacterium]